MGWYQRRVHGQNLKVIRNNNNIRAVLEMKEDSSLLHYG